MKTIAILFCAFALVGCDKKNEGQTASSASATPSAPASSAPVTSALATASNDSDVPSEEDFEDEAEKDITADTLDKELAAIQKEIEAN